MHSQRGSPWKVSLGTWSHQICIEASPNSPLQSLQIWGRLGFRHLSYILTKSSSIPRKLPFTNCLEETQFPCISPSGDRTRIYSMVPAHRTTHTAPGWQAGLHTGYALFQSTLFCILQNNIICLWKNSKNYKDKLPCFLFSLSSSWSLIGPTTTSTFS